MWDTQRRVNRIATVIHSGRIHMSILDRFRLDGQVAIITGGGGGLGSAMARAFADVGADIAVVGRSSLPLEKVRSEVQARQRRCAIIRGDVTDPDIPARAIEEAVSQLGRLTILVNNVGGIAGDDRPRPAMETSEESWARQIDLNLNSVFRFTRAAVPRMPDGGVILNMSSIKAFHPQDGSAAYAASKAAINNLTSALAFDLAPRFRVNAIAPGPIPTEAFMEKRKVTEADFPRIAREWGVPLARLGRVEDVAGTAVFLASPAGSWITGQTLIVAGGM
jgi:7-alpha-hydroxysteroid dehydrogenase